ncbi:MAG: hypothetical protein ABR506_07590 [Candidatus Krumholzibacteriia bacterium]
MTPALAKFAACLLVTAASAGVLMALRRRPREETWLRRGAAAAWTLRLGAAVALYVLAPHLVRYSDPVAFYLPETQALLAGRLPYAGFATSYSPLFHALLAPAVLVWPSPGAVVVVMLLAEGALVTALLRADRADGRSLAGSRTAWLIVTSPLQVYWVGVGGYNSILIAAFAGIALVAARRGGHLAAGAWGALAFLGCKALGLLAWPTVVLYGREGRRRRAAPLVATLALLAAAGLLGLDVLQPVAREAGRWAGGNVWVIAASLVPALYRSVAVAVVSALLALTAFALGTRRFAVHSCAAPADRLPAAVAHLGWMFAAFLVLSLKSMAMYGPMLAPFAAHVLVLRGDGRLRPLLPWFALGAVATVGIESRWLPDMIASRHLVTTGTGALVLAAELVRLAALVAIARACWAALGGPRPATREARGRASFTSAAP